MTTAALVQVSPVASVKSGTTITATLPANVTAGNCLVLIQITNDAGSTPPVPTLGGVTWVKRADSDPGQEGDPIAVRVWYGLSAAGGGGNNAKGHLTLDTETCLLVLAELSGVSNTLTQDEPFSIGGDTYTITGTSAGNLTPGPVTTTVDGDALVTVIGWVNITGSGVLGSLIGGATEGYATIASGNTTGGTVASNIAGAIAFRVPVTYGTTDPIWAINDPHIGYMAVTIALKPVRAAASLVSTISAKGGLFAMLSGASAPSIPPAIFDFDERYIFDGYDLSTYAAAIGDYTAVETSPQLRGSDNPFTGLPGALYQEKMPDSGAFQITIYLFPTLPDGTPDLSDAVQARVNLDKLYTIFGTGQKEFVRIFPDGSARVAKAQVWQYQPHVLGTEPIVYALDVTFHLADPYWYGAAVIDGPRTISASPTDYTVTHPGSVWGYKVVLELVGAFTNPRITNLRNGDAVEYIGALTSAQRLVIDSSTSGAWVNGGNVIGAINHYGDARARAFMRLEPGDNVLEVTAGGVGGTIQTTFLPPYK